MSMSRPVNVVYILLYFPRLTETFIADEIAALTSQNVDVRIVSLLMPPPGYIQPQSHDLLRQTSYAPRVPTTATWIAHSYFLITAFRVYIGLLVELVTEPYVTQPMRSGLKRVVVFIKAVSAAYTLRDSSIDVIHSHFAWLPGAAAWICSKLLRKPFTVTIHAYDIYSHRNDLLALVSRHADHVIAVSEFNRSFLTQLEHRPADNTSVIHCGIDAGDGSTIRPRRPHTRSGAPIRILSVGSLVTKKGHHNLVAACHLLVQRGFDFRCTIIGGGPNERALRKQIDALSLQDRVVLQGARPHMDIVKAYAEHDIFVLASVVAPDGDRDGIPVVLMEAGKAGLPIISTPVSGIPELIRHMETGWVVQSDNSEALADAIIALATDTDTCRRLGENARELVRAQFSIDKSAQQLAAVFQRLSAISSGTPA
jgi:colanic acid/amylovoran biosynthesis glycosyltransferase